VRTIIDLPKQQIEALKELGAQSKLSRAELIRRAVQEYVARQKQPSTDDAFGLWRAREQDGLAYQRALRDEWSDDEGVV
jgi:predicted transcriptional regulator